MFTYLLYDVTNQVCRITFNRPDQLNAMNRVFMDEIITAFHKANDDKDVRVVVVTGNGRAFMSGADLKEYAAQTDVEFQNFQKRGWELYQTAETSPKPYIAMVNGFALGGGFEIALACDLIIASRSAVFGLPEVHLGLVPGGGGTQKLYSRIGLGRALEVLMLGSKYSAEEMHRWGVVNFLVDDATLSKFTEEIAQKLTRRLPQSIEKLKFLARQSSQPDVTVKGMMDEACALSVLFQLPEVTEKLQNFMNR